MEKGPLSISVIHQLVCPTITQMYLLISIFLHGYQYLVMEYCKGNQWGRSSGTPSSQESWFWEDISWPSGPEDD